MERQLYSTFVLSEKISHAYHSIFLLTWKNWVGIFSLEQFNCILVKNILHIKTMKDDFICQTRLKTAKMKKKKKEKKNKKVFLKLLYEKDS